MILQTLILYIYMLLGLILLKLRRLIKSMQEINFQSYGKQVGQKLQALFSRIGSLTHRFWALVTWTPKLKVFCIYHCEYEILIPCKLRWMPTTVKKYPFWDLKNPQTTKISGSSAMPFLQGCTLEPYQCSQRKPFVLYRSLNTSCLATLFLIDFMFFL